MFHVEWERADSVGLKRLDTGALVKDYEENELVQPYQLAVTEVTFEDERFLVSYPVLYPGSNVS